MAELKDLIKSRRLEIGKTLEQVGKEMGVSKATVQRWESGEIKDMRQGKLVSLARALDTTPGYLMGWDSSSIPFNILPMPTIKQVPRLGTIACGKPILAEQNFDGYDKVPDYVNADFTLVCKGDSMINARIYDGDIVCIHRQETVEDGEIAAVLIGDEATLKRVRLFKDHIVLEPENPTYRPLTFWEAEMNNVHIIGKATHFISCVR
jgi:SOS-response transcriptional repressors (RecA-mediated autopeptidases)